MASPSPSDNRQRSLPPLPPQRFAPLFPLDSLRPTPGSNKPSAYGCPTTTQPQSDRLVPLWRHKSDAAAVLPIRSAAHGGVEVTSRMAMLQLQRCRTCFPPVNSEYPLPQLVDLAQGWRLAAEGFRL